MRRLLFIVLLFSISSCATFKKKSNIFSFSESKNLIISLQRGACYGNCPIYKIEVYSDGSAVYTGTQFVENIGIRIFNLSETQINLILTQADSIKFDNMKEEYSEPISDLPTTFIQIKEKRIRDHIGAPEALKNLEKLIDQLYQKSIKE